MPTIYLIRHGQASLGADDYDNLSPLGHQQAARLGSYLEHKGISPQAVFMGSLRRHAQTWAGMALGLGQTNLPTAQVHPGLNEYDSDAVIRAVSPETHARPTTPEATRAHFRRLRSGLQLWASGAFTPDGMPPYRDFAQGVADVLAQVRAQCSGDVFIVSSGGPIGTAVAQTLGASPEAFIELNMRIRNTAVTELHYTPKRQSLHTFNTLPHLDAAEYADWVTYA
jgi:broad specificity phosphatase PhoE